MDFFIFISNHSAILLFLSAEAVPWLIIVAAIWGVTNPFIKQGSRGIENINENNKFQQFVAELLFLFGNWKVYHLFNLISVPLWKWKVYYLY